MGLSDNSALKRKETLKSSGLKRKETVTEKPTKVEKGGGFDELTKINNKDSE